MKQALFLLALLLYGCTTTQSNYKASLVAVYDGDTFRVNLPCREALLCQNIPVRVRGVDCPEMNAPAEETRQAAKQARAFTKVFLSAGKIILRNCRRDKYFRIACDVEVNGQSLAEELLNAGLAVPYTGGKKYGPIQRQAHGYMVRVIYGSGRPPRA